MCSTAVGGGAEGAQHLALEASGVGEHGERLGGVGGDDDRVEARTRVVGRAQVDAVGVAADRGDRGAQVQQRPEAVSAPT